MHGIWSFQGLMPHRVIMYMSLRRGKGRRARRSYQEQLQNLLPERTTNERKGLLLLLLAVGLGSARGIRGSELFS